ncbi:unnamed protein product [Linum trigynum]|uniref:Uncharacterized protein n=1 Tax=Linum trigynum TaxID=586398 RepID=A0AAV2EG47_9ROSI
MAASDNEPAKLLLPYLQRADELQKHEPLVAYYCRLYAMERGLRIPQKDRTKTTNSLLVSLMSQLEKDKKTVKLGPEDNYYLEGFAQNVFSKADKQDRAGRADLNTAKTFYAASIFFEIINQFGPLQAELEQKQKYAVWKAADIRKALKEGRTPNPGPPVDDEDMADPSSGFTNGNDVGQVETSTTTMQSSESDPSSQFHDQGGSGHSADFPQSSQFHDHPNHHQHPSQFMPQSPPQSYDSMDREQHSARAQSHPPQSYDSFNSQHSGVNIMPSPPPYTGAAGYSQDFNPSENPTYSQPHHHVPQNYPSSHDNPSSYSYPNFQSYPSFADTSIPSVLPSVPSHYPSYYQQQGSSDSSAYSSQSAPPPATSYHPPPPPALQQQQHGSSSSRMSSAADASIPTSAAAAAAAAATYQYDSSYQPPPEKIVEAHKAARFAVGALAFDEVSIAVEHLKKALELLTNPSADP